MTAPAPRFYATSRGLLVAEVDVDPDAIAAGVLRRFAVRNGARVDRKDRFVIMVRVAADGVNAGYPQWRCECGVENCADIMAALEYVGGPRGDNPCLRGPGDRAAA